MRKEFQNLTILVNSCDKYSDLWDPFFKLFKKYGGDLAECPIVLNTESKTFSYEGLNIVCPNNYPKEASVAWSNRLRKTLETIQTDYVFFLLDDFFLQRPADCDVISNCIQWLDENEEVGVFHLISLKYSSDKVSEKFKDFCFVPTKAPFRITSQAAIWKKDVLFSSLIENESPWQWEDYGTPRNATILKKVKFYAISELVPEPYFYNSKFANKKYSPTKVQNAIIQGKWDLSCIHKCFEENDISIDYSIRGIYVPYTATPPPRSLYRLFKSALKPLLNPCRYALLNFFKQRFRKDSLDYKLIRKPILQHKKALREQKKQARKNK